MVRIGVDNMLYKRNVAFVGLELVQGNIERGVIVHVEIVTNYNYY